MRIYLGIHDIANLPSTYAKAFRALGYDTLTAVNRKNPFYPDSEYDFVLKPRSHDVVHYWRGLRLFLQAVTTCDVFIFTYASLMPRFIDVPLLKMLGKKMVFVFWGSEIRVIDFFEEQMRQMGALNEYEPFIRGMRVSGEEPLRNKLERIRVAERYGDLILSHPGYSQMQTRPYMRTQIPMDLARYRCNIPGRKEPIIIHAPSSPLTKGSDYIKETVESLRKEGLLFEFRLVEKLPNTELVEMLSTTDIVVDELYSDAIGVFSREGMATGNLVLTHHPGEFAKEPADCPVVHITRETLKDRLRRAILDLDWRCDLARRGREFVEKYNDHLKITHNLLGWLEPGGIREYDFVPEQINSIELKKFIASKIHNK